MNWRGWGRSIKPESYLGVNNCLITIRNKSLIFIVKSIHHLCDVFANLDIKWTFVEILVIGIFNLLPLKKLKTLETRDIRKMNKVAISLSWFIVDFLFTDLTHGKRGQNERGWEYSFPFISIDTVELKIFQSTKIMPVVLNISLIKT